MSGEGIHASWQHANVASLATACNVAGLSIRGKKNDLIARLTKALPATGYIANVGLSTKVGVGDDGNPLFERQCEAGEPVPDSVLEISGWWLYRAQKIRVSDQRGGG